MRNYAKKNKKEKKKNKKQKKQQQQQKLHKIFKQHMFWIFLRIASERQF